MAGNFPVGILKVYFRIVFINEAFVFHYFIYYDDVVS